MENENQPDFQRVGKHIPPRIFAGEARSVVDKDEEGTKDKPTQIQRNQHHSRSDNLAIFIGVVGACEVGKTAVDDEATLRTPTPSLTGDAAQEEGPMPQR